MSTLTAEPKSVKTKSQSQVITLIGAGGKMGCRITDNLLKTTHKVNYVEVSDAGKARLAERKVTISDAAKVIPTSDVVILAVPDVIIDKVSQEVTAQMREGALLIALDPAAPLAGKLSLPKHISCVIAHPCHPSVFNWEASEKNFRDFYGGITAKQPIVVAQMQGDAEAYEIGIKIAEDIFQPVSRVHRITLEQMAILEPALVETLAQTCLEIVKEGYEHVVELGLPKEAARDFLLGHLRIQIAVWFGETNGTFSDAAYKISKIAKPMIFKDDWKKIFEKEEILRQVEAITVK